eukprot:5882155-Pleurochrysis_carterae.AAC.3
MEPLMRETVSLNALVGAAVSRRPCYWRFRRCCRLRGGTDGSGAEGVPTSMCAAGECRSLTVVDWTGLGRLEIVFGRWTAAVRATMALAMIRLRSGG